MVHTVICAVILAAFVSAQTEATDLERAQALFTVGKRAEAKKILDKLCAEKDATAPMFSLRGLVLMDPPYSDEPAAERDLKKAINLDPEDMYANFGAGVLLVRQREYRLSLRFLDKVTKKTPDYQDAWYHLGISMYELARLEDSFQCFRRSPGKPEAIEYIGLIFWRKQRYMDAADILGRALKNLGPTWTGRGRFQYQRGAYLLMATRTEAAHTALEESIAAGYERAEALCELAKLHYEADALDKARALYMRATEADSIDDRSNGTKAKARAWFNLGLIAYNDKKYPDARTFLDKAVELEKHHENAWYKLGQTLRKLGQKDESRAAFDNHRRIQPIAQTIRSARMSLDNDANDHKTRFGLAELLTRLERHGEAMAQLRVLASRSPKYSGLYQALARTARAVGNEILAKRFDAAAARQEKKPSSAGDGTRGKNQ